MEGFDNVKNILTDFNGLVQQHSDDLAAAVKAGDVEAMQTAYSSILEAHRMKEDYTRNLVQRVAAARPRPPGMHS